MMASTRSHLLDATGVTRQLRLRASKATSAAVPLSSYQCRSLSPNSWMARTQLQVAAAAASASMTTMTRSSTNNNSHTKNGKGQSGTTATTTAWGQASAFGVAAAGVSMFGMGMTWCDASVAAPTDAHPESTQQQGEKQQSQHASPLAFESEKDEEQVEQETRAPSDVERVFPSRLNATSPVLVSMTGSSPLIGTKDSEDDTDDDTTTMSEGEARLEAATVEATKHSSGIRVFSGNGNRELAVQVAKALRTNLGRASVGHFTDGEVSVRVGENVRGRDVFIIQPTCPPGVNDNMMELLLMVSTLKRANAANVTAIIPYYGYARYDQKLQSGVPIAAADVARLLEAAGVDRVVAVDLHRPQIQGFFGPDTPVDDLNGFIVGVDYFGSKRSSLHRPVVVSPDVDGVHRARKFKEGLEVKYGIRNVGLATIVRHRPVSGMYDTMDLVGDVTGCDCIIVDDIVDSASILCRAVDVLKDRGARRVYAFVSHGVLSGPGNERIAQSALTECVILDTLPTTPQRNANEKLVTLSIAPLLAQTIAYLHAKSSLSSLMKAQQQPVVSASEETEKESEMDSQDKRKAVA